MRKIVSFINITSSKDIPKPYSFSKSPLQSNVELTNIISEIIRMLPQFSDFVSQFHKVINENNINVMTDIEGNLSIDVPADMSDSAANNISNRLNIIDRLIGTHKTSISNLFSKGLEIEQQMKLSNPNYVSPLSEQSFIFKELCNKYKH